MRAMTVFTTGRLAAYERMMQDYGDRYRGTTGKNHGRENHEKADKKVVQTAGLKAGGSNGCYKG